jgi:hypothetical protein
MAWDYGHARPFGRIFCLEGEWDQGKDLTDRQSVLPVLQLLEATVEDCRYVHRRVGTMGELVRYLGRWIEEDLDYYTLYLAFHGGEGEISIANQRMTLRQLGEQFAEDGLAGCVIYLGACSVMRAKAEIDELLTRTGARAAIGYTTDVEWIDGAAVDMIALGHLAYYQQLGRALNRLEGAKEYASLRRRPIGLRVQRHPRYA